MAFIRYTPKHHPVDFREFEKQFAENVAELQRCDHAARDAGELVGRYIEEPFADGKAIYQIIRQGKRTVRIAHCVGFGDDWVIPYWGYEATINIDYARKHIEWRDNLEAFIANHNAERRK